MRESLRGTGLIELGVQEGDYRIKDDFLESLPKREQMVI